MSSVKGGKNSLYVLGISLLIPAAYLFYLFKSYYFAIIDIFYLVIQVPLLLFISISLFLVGLNKIKTNNSIRLSIILSFIYLTFSLVYFASLSDILGYYSLYFIAAYFYIQGIFFVASGILIMHGLSIKKLLIKLVVISIIILLFIGYFGPSISHQFSNVMLNKSLNENNENYCKFITNREIKNKCFFSIGYAKNNIKICLNIKGDGDEYKNGGRSSCLFNVAKSTGDKEVCDIIEDQEIKSRCYNIIAFTTENEDITLCDKITNQNDKDNCLTNMASNKKDPQICLKVSSTKYSDFSTFKNQCYWSVAVSAGRSSICDEIDIQKLRESCIKQVN